MTLEEHSPRAGSDNDQILSATTDLFCAYPGAALRDALNRIGAATPADVRAMSDADLKLVRGLALVGMYRTFENLLARKAGE